MTSPRLGGATATGLALLKPYKSPPAGYSNCQKRTPWGWHEVRTPFTGICTHSSNEHQSLLSSLHISLTFHPSCSITFSPHPSHSLPLSLSIILFSPFLFPHLPHPWPTKSYFLYLVQFCVFKIFYSSAQSNTESLEQVYQIPHISMEPQRFI